MKNKIFSFFAMLGISFATFAQTPVTVTVPVTTNPVATDNVTTSSLNVEDASEDGKIMEVAKSTKGKKWSDRNLAGKILICVGAAAFVALCILLPNGWSSR